jgi:hypothetical protein
MLRINWQCPISAGNKPQASSSKLLTAGPGYDRMDLERKIMPKYKVLIDMDSPREEGEHLEAIFQNGIEAEDEYKAEMIVEKKIKQLMYGGPYYAITEYDEED